jgi:probable F420-dependent oxidoreductase
MQFGLHALGVGAGAEPAVIVAVAQAAERHGFSTLWAGEHVVMVDRTDSRYPYSDEGRIAVASDAPWLDPMVLLGFVAAVTTGIRIATGVVLLPEHNPLVVAKSAASLDALSKGRFVLGVGIGWSSEEFAALGLPFEGRARRTREYIEAMRVLWRDDVSSFEGEHVRFDRVRCYPKPLRGAVPVVLGGNSDTALARAGAVGDGWYGFNVSRHELAGRLEILRGSSRRGVPLRCSVALKDPERSDVAGLEALGVDELVLVGTPPDNPDAVTAWVGDLAHAWGLGGPGRG